MAARISTGPLADIILTVSNPDRSRDFYQRVLGFKVEIQFENGYMINNGGARLILFPAPSKGQRGDRFDEDRIGLQSLGFEVGSLKELQEAEKTLDELQVPHGLIQDYGSDLGLYSLKLRDPDGISIELLAPYKGGAAIPL